MFIVFPSVRFSEIGGFDNKYYMYMVDVDICRRLHKAGYTWMHVPIVFMLFMMLSGLVTEDFGISLDASRA